MPDKDGTLPAEGMEIHNVIEDAVDQWIIDRYIAHGIPKSRSLQELADALGIQDRQLKRYYYGETEISADKLVTLCNHIKIYTPIKTIIQLIEPSCLDDPTPFRGDLPAGDRRPARQAGAYPPKTPQGG